MEVTRSMYQLLRCVLLGLHTPLPAITWLTVHLFNSWLCGTTATYALVHLQKSSGDDFPSFSTLIVSPIIPTIHRLCHDLKGTHPHAHCSATSSFNGSPGSRSLRRLLAPCAARFSFHPDGVVLHSLCCFVCLHLT